MRGATKTSVGKINEPVVVGGATITAGDIVLLDADGGVVVPTANAAQVLQAAQERETREAVLRGKLQQGQLSYDLHGLRALLEP